MAGQKKFDPRRTSAQTPDAKAEMPTERPKSDKSKQTAQKPATKPEADGDEQPQKTDEQPGEKAEKGRRT
jgi:hypothetical protein